MAKPGNKLADKVKNISEKAFKAVEKEKLSVSFDYLDWETEIFFLHGLNDAYYRHLFDAFCEIKKSTADQIKLQTHPSLNPKCISWKNAKYITQTSFPSSVVEKVKSSFKKQVDSSSELQKQAEEMMKDSFELMVAKNSGRIHGFLFANKFHVVWFDPAHNLFPGMVDGKKRPIKLPKDVQEVKPFSPEEFKRLRDLNISLAADNEALRVENEELMQMLEIETN